MAHPIIHLSPLVGLRHLFHVLRLLSLLELGLSAFAVSARRTLRARIDALTRIPLDLERPCRVDGCFVVR
jgi:hypothetical protein